MRSSLQKLYALTNHRDRVKLAFLVGMMVIAAVLEVVGVGSIPAFVSVVVSPEGLRRNAWVGRTIGPLLPKDDRALIVWAVVALITVFTVKNGFLIFYYHVQMRFISDRRADLARRLVNAYMHAPYPFHLRRNTAELMRNVERETAIIAHQVLAALLELSTRVLILLAVLAFLLTVEPWITLAWVLLFGSMAVAGVLILSERLRRYGEEEQGCREKVLQALAQGFGSIKESRIMNREQFFSDIASESVRRMSEAIRFKKFTGAAMNPATELVAVTGLVVITGFLVLSGRSTEAVLATLSLFVVGLVRMRETASVAMTHLANLRYNIVAVDPVHADLTELEACAAERSASAPADAASVDVHLTRAIELRGVSFSYEGERERALHDVHLTIPAGSAVGIVGGTGAGKSTVIDLLLGLLEPESGQVLVDGVDVHGGCLRSWQRRVAYVPQSIYMLDDTIRNNIALGRADAEIDEQALSAAIHAAQIEDLLGRLPEGLDTRIGEHGVRLSGGERQRIGIARALYNEPEVLVLDEATSALDNTTERALIEAVSALKGDRTIIMVAHRLSTVRDCDELFLFRDGRLEARGRYEDLRSASAEFRRMAGG